jgi:hypothetical protein
MNDKQIRSVIRYLGNEMTDDERAAFEKKMERDRRLEAFCKAAREINMGLADADSLDFRQQLAQIMKEKNPGRRRRFFRPSAQVIWLAAIFIALLGILSVVYMSSRAYFRFYNDKESTGGYSIFRRDIFHLPAVYSDLIKYQVRNERFTMQEPLPNERFTTSSDIIFRWVTDLDQDIYFEILNRRGKVVYSANKPVTSPYLVLRRLHKGVYIYRFRHEESAIHYGVMYVE